MSWPQLPTVLMRSPVLAKCHLSHRLTTPFIGVKLSRTGNTAIEKGHSELFVIPSKEHPGLISFRMDWLDLLAVQGPLKIVYSVQFSSVTQSCLTLCNAMNHSTPGLPVHRQLPEFTETHVHWVNDAIQPSHPLSSPSPPAPNPSQHQSLFP